MKREGQLPQSGETTSNRMEPGLVDNGYQPQASGAVDPGQVKPPRGDTAIVAPQKPASKQ
jgi:hypothetical protein